MEKMSKVKNGKDVVLQEDNEIEISEEVRKKIDSIQEKLLSINKKREEQLLKIKYDYEKRKTPFFLERAEILKTIPQFWGSILSLHPTISPYLVDNDTTEALNSLQDINFEEFLDDKTRGYKLTLTFVDNVYFSNKDLVVRVTESLSSDELPKIVAEKINWKSGKSIVASVEAKNKAIQKKSTDEKSEEEKKNMDEEEIEKITFFSIFDFGNDTTPNFGVEEKLDLLECIHEDIYPNPLEFFEKINIQNGLIDPDDVIDGDGDFDDEGDVGTKKFKSEK